MTTKMKKKTGNHYQWWIRRNLQLLRKRIRLEVRVKRLGRGYMISQQVNRIQHEAQKKNGWGWYYGSNELQDVARGELHNRDKPKVSRHGKHAPKFSDFW